MNREESIRNHPAGKKMTAADFLSPTSETNPLMVPARLVTGGDHIYGMSVYQTRNLEGGIEINACIPRTTHSHSIRVSAEDADAVVYPVTKRGDSHSPAARNQALGMPVGRDAPPPYVAPEPVAVYPVGTRIGDVKHFDRGQKVTFHCPKHPVKHFASKDPFSSTWFDAGKEFGDMVDCDCNTRDFVIKYEYKPTRNG